MFPLDFDHDDEFHAPLMPRHTWYEEHVRAERRTSSPLPSVPLLLPEFWKQDTLVFDVRAAKELLIEHPRLPAFAATDLFDDAVRTSKYHAIIIADREYAWPWIHIHVPCIIGQHEGEFILLDGNHRYIKSKMLGHQYCLAYVLTPDETASIRTSILMASQTTQTGA